MYKILLLVFVFSSVGLSQWDVRDTERWWKKKELNLGLNPLVVTPEQFGADTNATLALDSAVSFLSFYGGGTVEFPKKEYTFPDSISFDGIDSTVSIKFSGQGYLYFTDTTSAGDYLNPAGLVEFKHFANVIIEGLTFQFTNGDNPPGGWSTNYRSGILFRDNGYVFLHNNIIRQTINAGVWVMGCKYLVATENIIDSCTYAGILAVQTDGGYWAGNLVTNTGANKMTYEYGYGLSFSHRFNSLRDNKAIHMIDNTVQYSTRKNLDIHGGYGININGNICTGWGASCISAHNETGGDFTEPWAKHVEDIIIKSNICEQDSEWVSGFTSVAPEHRAISTGNYDYDPYHQTLFSAGHIKIEDNLLKNINAENQRGAIIVTLAGGDSLTVDGREGHKSISVINNTIENVRLDTSYYAEGAISITRYTFGYQHQKELVIPFIDVSHNKIQGDVYIGVRCAWYDTTENVRDGTVMIFNNMFDGRFTYPIFFLRDSMMTRNNYYNGEPLMDITNNYEATVSYEFQTHATADSMAIGKWNLDLMGTDARISYQINITKSNDAVNHTSFYTAYAFVGSNTTYGDESGAGVIEGFSTDGIDPFANPPELVWRVSSNIRTLKFIIPDSYSKYKIDMKLVSRSYPLWSNIYPTPRQMQ